MTRSSEKSETGEEAGEEKKEEGEGEVHAGRAV
jgi:hypothetical protein